MRKTLLFSLFLAIVVFAHTKQAFAQSASASAVPAGGIAATASADPTDKLKERIDKVIEQQKDRIRGVMDNAGLKKKAMFGEVQRVTETNVTIKTAAGSEIFTMNSEIGILRDNKKVTIDDIAVGDWALALGYQKDNEFVLRRLEVNSVSPKPVIPNILIGTLKALNKAKTVIDMTGKFDQASHPFLLGKNTLFQDNRATSIKKEDLKVNTAYIILSEPAASGTPSANLVRSLAQ